MYDDLDFELHFMTTDITWRNITWHNMFWVMTRAVNLISRNFTVKILKAAHQLCSLRIRIPISHLLTINHSYNLNCKIASVCFQQGSDHCDISRSPIDRSSCDTYSWLAGSSWWRGLLGGGGPWSGPCRSAPRRPAPPWASPPAAPPSRYRHATSAINMTNVGMMIMMEFWRSRW